MKKLLAIVLTVILAAGVLAGCGKQNSGTDTDKELVKALVAAVSSKKVADFISEKYGGAVVSVVEKPGDGLRVGRLQGAFRQDHYRGRFSDAPCGDPRSGERDP